jgi:hypothetical protein
VSAETSRHPSLDELSAWVDGEIGDGFERQVLEEHVAACPSCASLVEDFRALAAAEVAAPVPPVPFHLQGRVLDRLAADRFGRRPVRRIVLPLSAAATLLIGVVAVWLYRQQPVSSPLTLDRMETRQAAPEPAAPTPQTPEAPPAEEALPEQKAAPPAASVLAPEPPPPEPKAELKEVARAKDRASSESAFAPVPPPPARQQPVALQRASARWLRLPSEPLAKTRRDETPAAAAAPAPAAEADARDLQAGSVAEPCAVRDLLRPPLTWEGMDAEQARGLADRARAAGASDVILATVPMLRLTLVMPVAAWPPVQEVLAASGIPIPDAVRVPPEGGVCLEVAIDPRP